MKIASCERIHHIFCAYVCVCGLRRKNKYKLGRSFGQIGRRKRSWLIGIADLSNAAAAAAATV